MIFLFGWQCCTNLNDVLMHIREWKFQLKKSTEHLDGIEIEKKNIKKSRSKKI